MIFMFVWDLFCFGMNRSNSIPGISDRDSRMNGIQFTLRIRRIEFFWKLFG